ncbi:MAG TPA: hypothetical protein VFJ11_00010, partial [Gaiellaceae bacterium]|nr:hypothetical protein [Gaiellaceae bacterium]
MHVVVNHLRLRDPIAELTLEAAREAVRLVVDAGALAARIAREVGGPWMRENVVALLAGDTE